MLTKINEERYAALLEQFPEARSHFYVRGVLGGAYAGGVYGDDETTPTAVLVVHKAWCHLLGKPTAAFVAALNQSLQGEAPLGEQRSVLFFVEPNAAWVSVLQTAVPNRTLIPTLRRLYRADATHFLPQTGSPPERMLLPIDDDLPSQVDGDLPDDVSGVLEMQASAAAADAKGFGFVFVEARRCVSWAVVDFVVADEGEIRLVTAEGFRRRGLAQVVASATLAAALERGLTAVWWNVAESNRPSIALAEKLGLALHSRPMEQLLVFPEVGYLINFAWHFLDQAQFTKTIRVAELMVEKEANILQQYGYFLLGAAHAGLENDVQAWTNLRRAVAAGFDDVHELNGCLPLKRLQGQPEWQTLLLS